MPCNPNKKKTQYSFAEADLAQEYYADEIQKLLDAIDNEAFSELEVIN